MKKTLLAIAALVAATVSINAMPSIDELSKLTLKLDKVNDVTYYTSDFVTIEEGQSDGTVYINNFANDMRIIASIDDEGNVSIAPQTVGGDYDYDTYETVYYMIVPAAATSKTPYEVYSERVNGTYKDGVLTIEPWNLIITGSYFSDNRGTVYTDNITTTIVAPNATATVGFWEDQYNDDWDFTGWVKNDPASANKNAYVVQEGKVVTVYNYDDAFNTAQFTIEGSGKSLVSVDGSAAYKNKRNTFNFVAIPEELTEEEVTPTDASVRGTIIDPQNVEWGNCAAVEPTAGTNHGSYVYSVKLALDNPLDLTVTGIESIAAGGNITGVKYVNLAGVESSEPFNGVNIKVITYDNGTTQAVKVIR